uniref:Uncharacterized protein n=1 Tax=Wuchereria bancrofti TaxID=6293 RepID=A0A1I8ENS5_WUCBA
MREQLDNERRRRRDYVDRSLAGDIGRLGGGYLGLRSTGGIHSAGILPHLGEDYMTAGTTRQIRPTFASNPLTPPLGTSTPTQYHDTQRESHISTSSYHPSMVGSTTSDKIKIETLAPSKEIEERRTKTHTGKEK